MQHWDTLLEREQQGFKIIVDKTWEDLHPRDCFDDEVYVIEDICSKIDSGQLDWFMARARVFVDDLELGSAVVGGFLYEDARQVLKDGAAEDLIAEALAAAQGRLTHLAQKFTLLAIKHA